MERIEAASEDDKGRGPRGGGGVGPFTLLGAALVVVVAGGLIGYWVFLNVAVRLTVTDQPALVQLPSQMTVQTLITRKLDVTLKGKLRAQVPLQQELSLPLKGTYAVEIILDALVPLKTVIEYDGTLPVDTIATITAVVPVRYQHIKEYRNLKVKARIPMKMNLPVKLRVPVDQPIRVQYRGPMKVTLDAVVKAPVGETLSTVLDVNGDFQLPVRAKFGLAMNIPPDPVKATIRYADLYLPLSGVRLEERQR